FCGGLTKLRQRGWGVLLVDLNLQESDGLELVRRAREQWSQTHICIMSSPGSLTERAQNIEHAEVSQVFAKPLNMDEIKQFLLRLSRGESAPRWRAATQTTASVFPDFPDIAVIERKEDTLDWGSFFQIASKGLNHPVNKGGKRPRFICSFNQRKPI